MNCGSKNLGGFTIEYEGETLLLIHNNSAEPLSYDLAKLSDNAFKIADFIGVGGAQIEGDVLTLDGYTSVIIG